MHISNSLSIIFFFKLADIIWIFNRLHFDHILAYKIIILWSNEFILLSRAPLLHSWQGDLAPSCALDELLEQFDFLITLSFCPGVWVRPFHIFKYLFGYMDDRKHRDVRIYSISFKLARLGPIFCLSLLISRVQETSANCRRSCLDHPHEDHIPFVHNTATLYLNFR